MKYTTPEMNIVMFEAEEVIAASANPVTPENPPVDDVITDEEI